MGEELKKFDMPENVSDDDFGYDDDDDEMFLSVEDKYPSERFKITHKQKMIASGILAVVIGLLIIVGIIVSAIGIITIIDPFATEEEEPKIIKTYTLEGTVELETYLETIIEEEDFQHFPPDDSLKPDYKVRNTAEYQLEISKHMFTVDTRTQIVALFLEEIRSFTNLPFHVSNGIESIRMQYDFRDNQLWSEEQCGQNFTHVRVRDYIVGPKEGSVTIDAKGNGNTTEEAMAWTFEPNPGFPDFPFDNSYNLTIDSYPSTFQKLEQDLHACNTTKYARETRLFMKHLPTIETCHDIMLLFPWIFPNITEDMYSNQIKAKENETWWVFEHKAYLYSTEDGKVFAGDYFGPNLGNGTLIESTFTLEYDNVTMAQNITEKPIKGGNEWSLRRYSLDDGNSDEWDQTVIDLLDEMYDYIASRLGFGDDKEKHCEEPEPVVADP